MISRETVYKMLTKEDAYAQGWGQHKNKGDSYTSLEDGQPYGLMDWVIFSEKYANEAKLAWANFTPDSRAVRIRLLKAASLLVTALQVHGLPSDLEDIAGVSSNRYPLFPGGLEAFKSYIARNEYERLDLEQRLRHAKEQGNI